MKNFILLFVCIFACTTIHAQRDSDDSDDFSRKGRILIESGYNLVSGFAGGTGLNIYKGDNGGESITSLGIDGGYFLSEDFAIKFRLGLLSSGGSLTNYSVGAKYYIAGTIPIEAGIGAISGSGSSQTLGNISIGYGISLAKNINLEPSIGAILNEEGALYTTGFKFAMFL